MCESGRFLAKLVWIKCPHPSLSAVTSKTIFFLISEPAAGSGLPQLCEEPRPEIRRNTLYRCRAVK